VEITTGLIGYDRHAGNPAKRQRAKEAQKNLGKIREAKFERNLEKVLFCLDMGTDPYLAIRQDPMNQGGREDMMSEESAAAGVLTGVYSSTEFSAEVQKRSARSGEILDTALEGLNAMLETFMAERADNPDISNKDAKITPQLFQRVTETVMKFYLSTQKQVSKQISSTSGGKLNDVLGTLSDAELRVLAHKDSQVPPTGEKVTNLEKEELAP